MANILVIDDEPVLLEVVCKLLRLDGHTVRAVADPLEALESRRAGCSQIDLLLTDINMKPISGVELAARFAKAGRCSNVILMSGYPVDYWPAEYGMRSRAVLEKPFTAAQLRCAVAKALSKTASAIG